VKEVYGGAGGSKKTQTTSKERCVTVSMRSCCPEGKAARMVRRKRSFGIRKKKDGGRVRTRKGIRGGKIAAKERRVTQGGDSPGEMG